MRAIRQRQGFTLVDVLAVVAILGMLLAILAPVFATAREAARGVSCLSNERQIGVALVLYSQDWDGCLPLYAQHLDGSGAWWEVLPAYCKSRAIFRCPSTRDSWGIDYGVSFSRVIQYPASMPWVTPETTGPARLDSFARPAETLVLADAGGPALYDPYFIGAGADPGFVYRHNGDASVLFLDGHARALSHAALADPHLWGHD